MRSFRRRSRQPRQQEADGSIQCMDPDLNRCPAHLLEEITRHMDAADRGNWRLVSKAACQAVYDSTSTLEWTIPRFYYNPAGNLLRTTALLPQLVAKCSGLKQLSCAHLPHLNSIAGLLQLPLGLEALDITYTDVKDLSFLAQCTSLRRLTAEHVPGCAGPASRKLAAVLQRLPGLTALKLHGSPMCLDAAHDVAAVLQSLTGLEELGMGGLNAATLFPAMPWQSLTSLRILNLDSCPVGAEALLPAILELTRLQQLSLTDLQLRAADARVLAPALRKLTQLEGLDLRHNHLGDKGIAALAPAIQQLTGLTSLNLRDNCFGRAGAQALVPALRQLTRLRHLIISFTSGRGLGFDDDEDSDDDEGVSSSASESSSPSESSSSSDPDDDGGSDDDEDDSDDDDDGRFCARLLTHALTKANPHCQVSLS